MSISSGDYPHLMSHWTLVVPVKGTSGSKSRLGASHELAMAIALDTVEIALQIAHVVVVTAPSASAAFHSLGATVVADPGGGLTAAIQAGLSSLNCDAIGGESRSAQGSFRVGAAGASLSPQATGEAIVGSVGVLLGDLPALTAVELRSALTMAQSLPLAFVPDHEMQGTTLVTATALAHANSAGSAEFAAVPGPAFGANSRQAHLDLGYVELAIPSSWGLRRDVDTPKQLASLTHLGPRTSALVSR